MIGIKQPQWGLYVVIIDVIGIEYVHIELYCHNNGSIYLQIYLHILNSNWLIQHTIGFQRCLKITDGCFYKLGIKLLHYIYNSETVSWSIPHNCIPLSPQVPHLGARYHNNVGHLCAWLNSCLIYGFLEKKSFLWAL